MGRKKSLLPILLTTMFASFMNPFMLSGVNISLPDIQQFFGCSATLLSWTINAFLLTNAIILLPVSKLSDQNGRAKYFKIGLYLFTLSSLAAALSPNIPTFIVFRAIQGAGSAMMQVTGMAIVTSAYPPERRGVALGLNIGSVYTGLSVGPFVGGLLTQLGGWQFVFLASVPLAIVAIILAHINLRDNDDELIQTTFDWKGSLIYAVAIVGIVYGGGKILSGYGSFLFATGLLLFIIFLRYEKGIQSPIFNVTLFKTNKLFSYSNLAALIHYTATSGIGFLLSLYLQISKGLTPRDAGLILVAQPIMMAISAPLTGRMSDKTRPGILSSAGMIITLACLFLFSMLHKDTSLFYIISVLVMLGLGFGLFSSPNTNAIMGSVSKLEYGIASGTSATMRVFGQTLSMMTATIFISMLLKDQQISPETTDLYLKSMKISFMLFAVLCVPGIWFSLQRNK
jgi:EmrB/QacA subfamily drug resistance transporter